MSDPDFEVKLINQRYKTAFDPISKRYVEIKQVRVDEKGMIRILARRSGDTITHEYGEFELTNFVL